MFRFVFFIEPTEEKWSIGPKIWRYYLNWFSIHEDAEFEMGKIHFLKPSYNAMKYYGHEDYEKHVDDRHEKGLGNGFCNSS